ncbi:MAG: hypothetical protein AABX33_07805 [Nanoarchaeota archaeon]
MLDNWAYRYRLTDAEYLAFLAELRLLAERRSGAKEDTSRIIPERDKPYRIINSPIETKKSFPLKGFMITPLDEGLFTSRNLLPKDDKWVDPNAVPSTLGKKDYNYFLRGGATAELKFPSKPSQFNRLPFIDMIESTYRKAEPVSPDYGFQARGFAGLGIFDDQRFSSRPTAVAAQAVYEREIAPVLARGLIDTMRQLGVGGLETRLENLFPQLVDLISRNPELRATYVRAVTEGAGIPRKPY